MSDKAGFVSPASVNTFSKPLTRLEEYSKAFSLLDVVKDQHREDMVTYIAIKENKQISKLVESHPWKERCSHKKDNLRCAFHSPLQKPYLNLGNIETSNEARRILNFDRNSSKNHSIDSKSLQHQMKPGTAIDIESNMSQLQVPSFDKNNKEIEKSMRLVTVPSLKESNSLEKTLHRINKKEKRAIAMIADSKFGPLSKKTFFRSESFDNESVISFPAATQNKVERTKHFEQRKKDIHFRREALEQRKSDFFLKEKIADTSQKPHEVHEWTIKLRTAIRGYDNAKRELISKLEQHTSQNLEFTDSKL